MEQRDWDWHAARRRCMSVARRVLRHREDAEEATQEALLRAWRARDRGTAVGWADAWLAKVTRNEAYRLIERRHRAAEHERNHAAARTAEDGIPALIDEIAVRQTLDGLAPTEKQALALRYLDDLTQAEVARRLAVPEGTVKVRLHRGRNHLRELMEGSQ
jgi:RNA polymerase sigma-70 factor (ECF subfamily)